MNAHMQAVLEPRGADGPLRHPFRVIVFDWDSPASRASAHARAWAARWADGDVAVKGDNHAQTGLRFAVYRPTGAANPEDERNSIGGRAVTGDGYLGHGFGGGQHRGQEGAVALGGAAPRVPVRGQPPAEVVEQPTDLVALPRAAGWHARLLAARRPGVAQRVPRRETRRIANEQHGAAPPRRPHERRPDHRAPAEPALLIALRDGTARLLVGAAECAQQFGHVVHAVEHPALVLEQVLDHRTVPTAGARAGRLRPGQDEGSQVLLRLGQPGRAPRPGAPVQAGALVQHQAMQLGVVGQLAHTHALRHHRRRVLVGQQHQRRDAPRHAHVVALQGAVPSGRQLSTVARPNTILSKGGASWG